MIQDTVENQPNSFYEYLEEIEKDILPDSRLDPLFSRNFQLKLIYQLNKAGCKDQRLRSWKYTIRSNKRKLTRDQRNTLKKIFLDYFKNKDPETYHNKPTFIKVKCNQPSHYICVENNK